MSLDENLREWFEKWHRAVVTGRCLIELKNMNKQFIKELKEDKMLGLKSWQRSRVEQLAGKGLI